MSDQEQEQRDGRSRAWPVLAVFIALIPIVPIVIGAVIASGGTGAGAATTSTFRPLSHPLPPPTHNPVPALPGTTVALLRHGTTMRGSPGGKTLATISTHTEFGSPQALWVVARAPGWVGVVSPLAGNGRIGWIPVSAAVLTRVTWKIEVSLAGRQLTVIHDGRTVQRYTVAIGRPSAPTPTGRFAITDRLETGDPSGPYGCCVLALSAHSPHAIQGWSGGDRIAIHSTTDTSSIGEPVSHGCLRVTLAEGRWLMNHVPLGTPTLISSG